MFRWQWSLMVLAMGVFYSWASPSSAVSEETYRYETGLVEFARGEQERYRLSPVHPYAFDLKSLQSSMWALAYQDRDITWSKKKHVFNRPAVKVLGPQLVDLFRKVGRHQKVTFAIRKASGKILFGGDVFLTPEGLNWRVTHFKGARKQVDDFSVMGDSERLVPLKGQVYKAKEDRPGLVQEITNWIIVTSLVPHENRRLPDIQGSPPPGAPEIARQVRKRLEVLETLKKEGVITDAEYARRREEILKGF